MAYSKQRPVWVDYPDESTVIRAQDLNGIEAGIAAAATTADSAAQKSANLSDLASTSTARTNLGLGTAATTDTGTGAGNVVLGNDSRLTDARTPTAHTHVSTEVTDSTAVGRSLLTAADATAARTATGAAAASHTHAATDIASGTVGTARLGSGTANSTTYLRGDQTWATVTSGGPGVGYQKLSASSAVRMYDANRVDTNAYNTLSQLTFAPFYMAYGGNLLRHFYVNVGTTAATSVIRLGVYAAGSDGLPGALVVDLGTVSGSAATGDVILSRSAGAEIQLAPGLYFLAAVIQTAACTVARYVSSFTAYGTGIYGESPLVGTGAANNATIPFQNSVTGALPATASISGISNTGIFMTARVQ